MIQFVAPPPPSLGHSLALFPPLAIHFSGADADTRAGRVL